MKDDLNASEKRLIAALDRIDQFIDRTASMRKAAQTPAAADDMSGDDLSLAQGVQDKAQTASDQHAQLIADLAQANARLDAIGAEAARLSAANEALAAANRALMSAQPVGADQIRAGLQAEIESLQAARAAEMAQMGDIIDGLDRMLATAPALGAPSAPQPPAMVETPMPAMIETPMPINPRDGQTVADIFDTDEAGPGDGQGASSGSDAGLDASVDAESVLDDSPVHPRSDGANQERAE